MITSKDILAMSNAEVDVIYKEKNAEAITNGRIDIKYRVDRDASIADIKRAQLAISQLSVEGKNLPINDI